MSNLSALLDQEFGTISALVRLHARERPAQIALIHDDRTVRFDALDRALDRVAVSLARAGVGPRDSIAICATTSIEYVLTFLGALRAGVCVAPLPPSATSEALLGMVRDAGAKLAFVDAQVAAVLPTLPCPIVALESEAFEAWLAPDGSEPEAVVIAPLDPFNIIYSSGTTGVPKGIVQPHLMRWAHVRRGGDSGYGPEAVTLVSLPLYSNTTLVSFFPGLALGGSVVLMAKFDVVRLLELSQKHRVTHAMLVPVQYQRVMASPRFSEFDLSSYRMKYCTSAPFAAALKADILARWPGGLVEYYGMTEGGGTVALAAHEHPTKLHTVGKPAPGHDVRLIDEHGVEVGPGQAGEVVGHSPMAMMLGYHHQPEKTDEATWHDASGKRFIRTGDIGRFDEDGFLTLLDRKKDMIISGGFNVYPSDLEAVLVQHPAVHEASVVGVPSPAWGETPVAFVVLRAGHDATAEQIQAFVNERVGKVQRLSALRVIDVLPRSAIGKVLKRELRDRFVGA